MKHAQERLVRELYARHAAAAYPQALALADGDRERAGSLLRAALMGALRRPAAAAGADIGGRLADELRRRSAARPRFGLLRRRRGAPAEPEPARPPVGPPVIADTLAGLPSEHRDALVETFLRGRTVQQAAEALGVPPQAVKSRLYYGLHRLVLAIEEQESAR
ncbi:sigma factor-like helix-turn-helix DNA-binding protein [Kitasatospora sp. NPDC058190]|uniref:sigma factor-like helix-turn-helix DNA-binding protein n=1 Tax=Kitasatospora sp. NPDC058190 TaxID=3346371 RepID=UPI0036DCCA68